MDTNAATSDLASVQHQIVGARACAPLVGFKQVAIAFERRSERVVHELVALLLRDPVEHREIDDPEKRKRVGVEQVFLPGDVQAQLAEHLRRGLVRTRRHQHEIRWSRARQLQRAPDRVFAGRLQRGALNRRVGSSRPHQPARAQLLRLLDELVELASGILRSARHGETAHLSPGRDRVAEHCKLGRGERGGQIFDLHATAEVRLVRPVFRDRLRIWQPEERARCIATDERHDPLHQRLERREHEVLGRVRDLEVHLREFWLAIRAQILVAKTLHDLKIPIHAGNHQDLLEDLRRLRQRVELARMHAARHEVVARPFRRGFREHRRLDFEEALFVEVLPDRHRHAVAHDDVPLHARPAQIDVAVLQPRLLRHLHVVANHEGGRLRFVEQPDLARPDLDLAGRNLGIHRFRRPMLDAAYDGDHELRAKALGLRDEFVVVSRHDLRDAVPIAQIDEDERSEVSHPVHPAQEDDILTDLAGAERAAGVRARQFSQWFYHHGVFRSAIRDSWFAVRRIAAATDARAIDSWAPVCRFLIVTSPRASSSPPRIAANGIVFAAAYFICFPSLSGSG